jgi:hypothetical protein
MDEEDLAEMRGEEKLETKGGFGAEVKQKRSTEGDAR